MGAGKEGPGDAIAGSHHRLPRCPACGLTSASLRGAHLPVSARQLDETVVCLPPRPVPQPLPALGSPPLLIGAGWGGGQVFNVWVSAVTCLSPLLFLEGVSKVLETPIGHQGWGELSTKGTGLGSNPALPLGSHKTLGKSDTFPVCPSEWQRAKGRCLCKCFANDAIYL